MIRFWCQCGRQLQAHEKNIGELAQCPLCRRLTVVPESDQPRTADFPPVPPRGGVNAQGEITRSYGDITRHDTQEGPSAALPTRSEYDDDDDRPPGTRRSPFMRQNAQTCQEAQTAMILGLLGIFCCALASPFALVYGIRALNQINTSDGYLTGKGQAIIGIVLGSISLVLIAVNIFLMVMS